MHPFLIKIHCLPSLHITYDVACGNKWWVQSSWASSSFVEFCRLLCTRGVQAGYFQIKSSQVKPRAQEFWSSQASSQVIGSEFWSSQAKSQVTGSRKLFKSSLKSSHELKKFVQVKPQVKSWAHKFGQVKPQVKSQACIFGQVKPQVKSWAHKFGQVKSSRDRIWTSIKHPVFF